MCGIAGYSVSPESSVDRTLAAQALLAGIAERGADAVGYAHRGSDGEIAIRKRRSGAAALLEELHIPGETSQALVHVRDYTKGHPRIEANNHPIRHGAVVGIHNGIILNDEEIFARYGFERAEPEMTVDSEAIFALAEHAEGHPEALEELLGAMATAWFDERLPETVFLARAVGRPLWVGLAPGELFFASTRDALEVLERTLRLGLRKREVDEGTLLRVEHGHVVATERFKPDHSYVEETILPSVRAPHEGRTCLQRLAAILASTA
jgi:glucosamine 6-phosphate synthetase-like amidotransferase/phosphosugar isomerase protein